MSYKTASISQKTACCTSTSSERIIAFVFLAFSLLFFFLQDSGVLRADEFSCLDWEGNPGQAELIDLLRVHDYAYVQKLGAFFKKWCVCVCVWGGGAGGTAVRSFMLCALRLVYEVLKRGLSTYSSGSQLLGTYMEERGVDGGNTLHAGNAWGACPSVDAVSCGTHEKNNFENCVIGPYASF